MRKVLLGTVLAFWGSAAHAQAPVIDLGAIQQLYQNNVQTLKDAAVQIEQLKTAAQEVEWATQTFYAFVANPNLGSAMGLLSAAGVSDPLPISPYTIQSLITGQGGLNGTLGSLSSFANSASGQNHIYTPTDNTWASQQMIANANGVAGAQGIAQQVYGQMAVHFPIIQSLQADMLTATTPSQRESLSGQIQAQQAWVQGAQSQMESAHLLLVAQQDNRAQRDDEHMSQSIDAELAQARANGAIP